MENQMPTDQFVADEILNYDYFHCCGDEDLYPFKCSNCGHIMVLCYECDTLYPYLTNTSEKTYPNTFDPRLPSHSCPNCGYLFEYYFIKNKYESSYLFLKGKSLWALLSSLDFYAYAGLGGAAFSVNPNDALKQRGISEPGSTDFNGFSLVIPGGIGATLIYSPNINFGVEFGGRWANTDYIDGFDPDILPNKVNDKYYFLNFTVTHKLKTGPKGWPSLR